MENNLKATLERLSKLTAQNQGGGGAGVKFFSPKPGKNNVLVFPTKETGDPFLTWGEHKSLQDVAWKAVPCDKKNKGEECIVCQVVKDLQDQNWKGNFKIWKPIEMKLRYFSPVVDLDDIEAGLQWWGYGKSVLGQFENWLINLEEGELPFYDADEPEKIIVSYDKNADPSLMYKLEHKAFKGITDEIKALAAGIKPLADVMKFSKSKEELAELLEAYMAKIQDELESEEQTDGPDGPESAETSDETQTPKAGEVKLGKLKGGKA